MLGNNTLVAPVLHPGLKARDIYLPEGSWRSITGDAHATINGPMWLRDYKVPIGDLPIFQLI